MLADGGVVTTDCYHDAWSTSGLVQGNGFFVATYGHGKPGTIRRSTDGVSWQDVLKGPNFESMLFGDGVFVGGSKVPLISTDDGATWDAGVLIDFSNGSYSITNCRSGIFGGRDAGVFVLAAGEGTNFDFAVSADHARSWARPTMTDGGRVDPCGSAPFAAGNGLLLTTQGTACRSADNGHTWDAVGLKALMSPPVWSGTEFVAWSLGGNPRAFRSTDGEHWAATPIQVTLSDGGAGPPIQLGPVAVNARGAYVAVIDQYERQVFFRSPGHLVHRRCIQICVSHQMPCP